MYNRLIGFFICALFFLGCKNAEDYFSEGLELSSTGYVREAISKFDHAIQENPYQKDAYLQMGICYTYLNQEDSAIRTYRKLLLLYPENTAANYYSGVARYKQQKFREAVLFFNKALDSKGGFNATDTNSIQTLIDLYKDNFESENAEMDIPTREILYDRAMANYKSGNFQYARNDFSDCIIQNFNPGTCYYMIGMCRLARKEIKYAREAFFHASNYGDSLALKKLSFLESSNQGGHYPIRKKA
jgi:tetratricopeptide (TPR) repeat protein